MNRNLFASSPGLVVPTDTVNAAGGTAYSMSPQQVLAQIACTSFFGDTFYATPQEQLATLLDAARQCDDAFVAKAAVYARRSGLMKDTPAVLCAYLFGKRALTDATFFACIDNVKMLSNFVRCVRSGQFGRRSLGSAGKRMIGKWLARRSVETLWRQSIAKDPSLADILRLARPQPLSLEDGKLVIDAQRRALYGLLVGKTVDAERLPLLTQQTLVFLRQNGDVPFTPDVPFNMIDTVKLRPAQWAQMFLRGGTQFVRMNLCTAVRQGVINEPAVRDAILDALTPERVRAARQLPLQMLKTIGAIEHEPKLPAVIRNAVRASIDATLHNVPKFEGRVVIAVDVSGSMYTRQGSGGVAPLDTAAVFAAAVLRNNPTAELMVFDDTAKFIFPNPADSVATIADRIRAHAGGGTNCSAPLRLLHKTDHRFDLFVMISDDMSWMDSDGFARGTASLRMWDQLKVKNPNAKQVRINVVPSATNQLPQRADTLRVAGLSDAVFGAVAAWASGKDWVSQIEEVTA